MQSRRNEIAAILLLVTSGDIHIRAAAKKVVSRIPEDHLRILLATGDELHRALEPLYPAADQLLREVKENLLSLIKECLEEKLRET